MTRPKAASLLVTGMVLGAACSSSGGSPPGVQAGDWTAVGPAPPNAILGSAWAAGSDVYAAALADGTSSPFVLSSHDRGITWASAPIADAQGALTGVAATSEGEVYAVGYTNPFIDIAKTGPLVAKSIDGGATFAILNPDLDGAIFAVWVDLEGGLVVGGSDIAGGYFARSTDGGLSWTRTLIPGTSYVSGLWVSAAGEIYAAGGAVFKSTDGGATWAVVEAPPTQVTAISGSSDGARVVGCGAGLLVVESRDGGATWQVLSGSAALVGSDSPQVGGVWVADDSSDSYFAAGRYGVLRTVSTGDAPGTPYVSGGEFLPDAPIVYAVTGDDSDVWAVGAAHVNGGSAIYHKTLSP